MVTLLKLRDLSGRCAALCLVIGFCLCLVADYFFARANIPNADGMSSFNELSAIRAGHLLLAHWVLPADNFYFTDMPFYVVGGFVFNHGLKLTYIVPCIVFAVLLLGCLLLVARATESHGARIFGMFAILFLLGLPFGPVHLYLLQSAYHAGTMALCVIMVLCAQPALSGSRYNRFLLLPFALSVFCVVASDPLADIVCVAPLLLLVVLRAWLWQKFRLNEWLLFAVALFASGLGAAFAPFVQQHGGFTSNQNFTAGFVSSPGGMLRNANALAASIQVLFSARSGALAGIAGHRIVAAIRLATLCIAAGLCLSVVWRAPRAPQSGVAQWLVLGAICLLGVEIVSGTFAYGVSFGPDFPGPSVRYVMPAYVFMSVAAAVEAGALFNALSLRLRWAVVLPAIAAAGIFGGVVGNVAVQAALAPPGYRDTPQYQLAGWLARRHFRYGYSDYWTSQMVLAMSRGAVITDPVGVQQNALVPFGWVCDISRFNQGWKPQFVVIHPGNVFGVTLAATIANFGQPIQIFQVGPYTVVQLARVTN